MYFLYISTIPFDLHCTVYNIPPPPKTAQKTRCADQKSGWIFKREGVLQKARGTGSQATAAWSGLAQLSSFSWSDIWQQANIKLGILQTCGPRSALPYTKVPTWGRFNNGSGFLKKKSRDFHQLINPSFSDIPENKFKI
jgi:hypothetical protein